VTDDEFLEVMLGWSTAQVDAFGQDEERTIEERQAVWHAKMSISMRTIDGECVLLVPPRLVNKARAWLAAKWPDVAKQVAVKADR